MREVTRVYWGIGDQNVVFTKNATVSVVAAIFKRTIAERTPSRAFLEPILSADAYCRYSLPGRRGIGESCAAEVHGRFRVADASVMHGRSWLVDTLIGDCRGLRWGR